MARFGELGTATWPLDDAAAASVRPALMAITVSPSGLMDCRLSVPRRLVDEQGGQHFVEDLYCSLLVLGRHRHQQGFEEHDGAGSQPLAGAALPLGVIRNRARQRRAVELRLEFWPFARSGS
jgi:hypothetical protein